MKKALLTSEEPMTDDQKRQLVRLGEDSVRKGLKIIRPSKLGAQRIHACGDELMNVIIDKMRELSFTLPELLGFTIADWQKLYGVSFTQDQIARMKNQFPWSDTILNSPCPFHPGKIVRETHFAFMGVDTVSIMELQKLNPRETEPRFYRYAPDAWYTNEQFANEVTLRLRWYLLLKDIVPNSENKTFDEQKAMLPKEYEVPSAVVETAKDLLIYKKTGIYVNPDRYARTADLDSDRSRVDVGGCGAGGVLVDYYRWDDLRRACIGVAASRKFEHES